MDNLDRAAMRLVVAVACSAFIGCCWFLSNKRVLFVVLLTVALGLLPHNALASCTTHSVYGPGGTHQTCTTCCNNSGVCNTHCF